MIRLTLTVALTAACVFPAGADDIRLRPRIELDGETTSVRLRDVATLSGAAAKQHADLVVATLDADAEELTLTVTELRTVLDAAGVHWGRVNLNGHRSRIRRAEAVVAAPAPPIRAMDGDEINSPVKPAAEPLGTPAPVPMRSAAPLLDTPTIAGALARRLVGQLGRPPEDVRFALPAEDRHWLDVAFAADTANLTPRGSVRAARVTWEYRSTPTARPLPITTFIEVRSRELVVQRELRRGEAVSSADVTVREIWHAPVVAESLARPEDLADGEILRRVEAGEVLRRKHVAPRRVVQRGDTVRVQCDVGGTRISLDADAGEDGAVGELITLRTKTGRRTFRARIVGPGAAVVDLTTAPTRSGDAP